MIIRYELFRRALIREGLVEREPFTYYYGAESDEMIFTPEPDPDDMIETTFALADIGLWDSALATRVGQRLATILGQTPTAEQR